MSNASVLDRQTPVEGLLALEQAIDRARILASRASALDLDEQLGHLHEIALERRRRAERAAQR